MKYRSHGNFFSLPNEIFLWGLNSGAFAVYSFLRRCEDRKTHQCWPSIKTIGKAVNMSENTVKANPFSPVLSASFGVWVTVWVKSFFN